MSRGRLEAQSTFLTAQVMTVVITAIAGSPFTVTVAAGSYYPTALLAELQTQLTAATALDGAWTVTASWGEAGTGLVTIAHATQTVTITWTTATELRDVLGFAGTLTPAALTFTGTLHARGVWLPDCPMAAKYGPNDPGHTVADRTESMSPRGDVWALQFQTRVVLPSVRWSHVSRARARIQGEVVTGESFERWWRYTHGAELSYFAVSPPVRLIWDADVPGTYDTYRLTGRTSTEMERAVEEWAGLFPIEISGVKVPT